MNHFQRPGCKLYQGTSVKNKEWGRQKADNKGLWYPTSTEFILRVVGDFEGSQEMLKRKKWSVAQEG